ncbi:efflux RND transporter periplasmic adaptor subunit [Curtobacterium aetherium]|uniref:Peptidoglycan-binding protein n=1 Tax=Curtobacterium aetherium TaxID=2841594 RepID=A0ACD1E212_9MICO|nr:peptidoglycan-binding protein [Curtobacterium sp. L6-1]QWS32791.1 peptidoglycan-binding protein [Curtobacterium sp. L6-1]
MAATSLVVVLCAGAATWAVTNVPEPSNAAATPARSTATAAVERGDLRDSTTVAGTLGYGAPVGVPGSGTGTLTWLPKPGQVVHRDEPLYAVDEVPVRAMRGSTPLWRSLESGLRGADVRQLNENLAALGYDVVQDDVFGRRTLAAVLRWQADRHLPRTGSLDATQVAFVDGDVRVASVPATLGQPPSGDVLQVTSPQQVVTADLPQRDADVLAVGTSVRVGVNGSAADIPGKVVDSAPTQTDDGKQTVTVTIELDAGGHRLPAAASAQVVAEGRTERGVLSVPVSALVASRHAGFAVDVVGKAGATRRVEVEVGFVADGRAEVRGDLRAGDRVVVPS